MIKTKDILDEFADRGNSAADVIASMAVNDDTVLSEVFQGVVSSNKRIKNAAAKTLKIISENEPAKLYSQVSFFTDLMNSDDTILKWIAIDIVGNLSYVDTDDRIDKLLMLRFFELLRDKIMITAGHSIDNIWKIALNKPHLRKEIVAKLLMVNSVKRNQECCNILIGKVISAFSRIYPQLDSGKQVMAFVKRQQRNPRDATRKKAGEFLNKFAS
jgi:hypothetical protein